MLFASFAVAQVRLRFSKGCRQNVKFHKNCENTGKILKISCVRCHFGKFDILLKIFFGVITHN